MNNKGNAFWVTVSGLVGCFLGGTLVFGILIYGFNKNQKSDNIVKAEMAYRQLNLLRQNRSDVAIEMSEILLDSYIMSLNDPASASSSKNNYEGVLLKKIALYRQQFPKMNSPLIVKNKLEAALLR